MNLTITEASIDLVSNRLRLDLQIEVLRQCLTCRRREMQIIEKIFQTNFTFVIPVHYRFNCSATPVDIGTNVIRLQRTDYQISSSTKGQETSSSPTPHLSRSAAMLSYNDSCPLNQTTTTTSPVIIDSQGKQQIWEIKEYKCGCFSLRL